MCRRSARVSLVFWQVHGSVLRRPNLRSTASSTRPSYKAPSRHRRPHQMSFVGGICSSELIWLDRY